VRWRIEWDSGVPAACGLPGSGSVARLGCGLRTGVDARARERSIRDSRFSGWEAKPVTCVVEFDYR
jgi:hypothetical protein